MPQPSDAETPRSKGLGWIAILPLAVFAVLVGFFGWSLMSGRDPAELPSVMIDRPVPDFDLPPLDEGGQRLTRADLGGKPALVNFFASWCAPCRAEHGVLAGYADSGGIPIYGIAYKDKPEDARRFIGQLGNPYARIALDLPGRTAIDFGVYGVPETYLVDAAGRIRYRYAGPVTADVLRQEILPRLAALEAGK